MVRGCHSPSEFASRVAARVSFTYFADSNADRENHMEQTIFMICMFFGVAAVALIAFTLLMIALGRVDV